jgi:nucleoside-triphosphatase
MPPESHRYQEKLKHDLTLEGAKNLILISRKWRERTGVISRLIPELKKSPVRAEGFYTEDIFENRKRVGYLTKTLQGESRILAKSGLPSELCVDRFGVDLQTVETLVVPAIETALRSADLLIMGQIGKMEIASPRFRDITRQALNSPLKIIATVPNYPLKFLNEIRNRPDVLLVEITKENENYWPEAILKGFVPLQKSKRLS